MNVLKKENISRYTINVNSDIFEVWDAITNNEDWQWRSDLKDVRIDDIYNYVEYKKNGDVVNIEVVKSLVQDEYAVKFHSSKYKGLWKCNFFSERNGNTRLEITQSIIIKNPIKNLFANIFLNINDDEKQFELDLKNKLLNLNESSESFYNLGLQ